MTTKLSPGHLGVVLAGHGVGKTAFLVGLALDELLRGGRVLHVSVAHSVSHVRTHYDTVFAKRAQELGLEDAESTHDQLDQRRSIRVYPASALSTAKLRDAVKFELEAGALPTLLVIEGLEVAAMARADLADLKSLAQELPAAIWLESARVEGAAQALPVELSVIGDLFASILTLEPGDGDVSPRELQAS